MTQSSAAALLLTIASRMTANAEATDGRRDLTVAKQRALINAVVLVRRAAKR